MKDIVDCLASGKKFARMKFDFADMPGVAKPKSDKMEGKKSDKMEGKKGR